MMPKGPSREAMLELALEVNAKKLPPIAGRTAGLCMPPPESSLLNKSFRVAAPPEEDDGALPPAASPPERTTPLPQKPASRPSGKQIKLNLRPTDT